MRIGLDYIGPHLPVVKERQDKKNRMYRRTSRGRAGRTQKWLASSRRASHLLPAQEQAVPPPFVRCASLRFRLLVGRRIGIFCAVTAEKERHRAVPGLDHYLEFELVTHTVTLTSKGGSAADGTTIGEAIGIDGSMQAAAVTLVWLSTEY